MYKYSSSLSVTRIWSIVKQKTSQNIPFRLGLPPVDTGVPNSLLMLQNSLNDFVFEDRSGCCATDPGYTGDIGAIEI